MTSPLQRLALVPALIFPLFLFLPVYFIFAGEDLWATPPTTERTVLLVVGVALALLLWLLLRPRTGSGTSWPMAILRGFLCSIPCVLGLALTFTARWPRDAGLTLYAIGAALTVVLVLVEMVPDGRAARS